MSESDKIRFRREAENYLIKNNHNFIHKLQTNFKEALIELYIEGFRSGLKYADVIEESDIEERIDKEVKERMEDDDLISIKEIKL